MLLTGESSDDFREELFYLLSGAGLPILEMKKENLSLEQIFLKLTTTETESEMELSTKEPQADTVQLTATEAVTQSDIASDQEPSARTESASSETRTGEESK
jgi:ABC-2 type transport system ATP-binding protein